MLATIAGLLFILVSLAVLGEPLRIALSHFTRLFSNLDIIQVLTIDVYFGGLILFAVAFLPLRLVNLPVMLALLLLSAFFVTAFHLIRLTKKQVKLPVKSDIYCYLLVASFFFSALLIEFLPTTNFIFGSVHDTSLTALFSQVILENQQMPTTLLPYLPEGIVYPQAFFIITAYASLVLGLSVAEIPLVITPLFQALSILGVYYLGKKLLNRKLAISLSFIFAFASPWPKFVTWGSNAFVFGFPLFFICLSLFYNLKYSPSQSVNKTDLFIIGILYGYLAAIHLMIFFALLASMSVWILVNMLHYGRQSIRRELMYLLRVTLVSIIPVSVFAYRAIIWYQYPNHNVGLPTDVAVEPFSLPTNKVTDLVTEPINEYPWLALEVYLLAAIGILLMVYYYRRRKLGPVTVPIHVVGALVLGCLSVLIVSLLQFVIPLLTVFVGESVRYGILLNTAIYLSLGVFFILIYHYLEGYESKKAKPAKKQIKTLRKHLPVLLVFSLISVPIVCNSVIYDVQTLTHQYSLWAVTKQDDLLLMQWMRGNLPANATILINPDDAGGFIPAVANCKIIYPFTTSRDSRTYLTLVALITQSIFNSTTYSLMKDLNVTHVFIGSSAAPNNQSLWSPVPMLIDPHFELIKEIGASYLFKIIF